MKGEGCSHWFNHSNNENHDSQVLVTTSHTPNGAEVLPANNVVIDNSLDVDNTVAELIDGVDSDI